MTVNFLSGVLASCPHPDLCNCVIGLHVGTQYVFGIFKLICMLDVGICNKFLCKSAPLRTVVRDTWYM